MTYLVTAIASIAVIAASFAFLRPAWDCVADGDLGLSRFTVGARVAYALASVAFVAACVALFAVACGNW